MYRRSLFTLVAFLALAVPATLLAQGEPEKEKPVPALALSNVSVRELAERLSKESGGLVVADRTLATRAASLRTIGGPLEAVLAQLLPQLPKGTVVRKTLLPPLHTRLTPTEIEEVSRLAAAQEALRPVVSGSEKPAPSPVNFLGRWLSGEALQTLRTGQNLRVVYILTNPDSERDPVGRMNALQADTLKLWGEMSDDQRRASTARQWDDFFNMDQGQRDTFMTQMLQMGQDMQKLPFTPQQVDILRKTVENATARLRGTGK